MLDGSLEAEEDCALLGGFLDAVRAASSLLLADAASTEVFCGNVRFSSGREEEEGLELELDDVGFGGAVDGFSEDPADEFSFGIRPFGVITFVLVGPDLLAPADGGTFPALIASYCASLICRSFSERRGSFRIRSRILFCSR